MVLHTKTRFVIVFVIFFTIDNWNYFNVFVCQLWVDPDIVFARDDLDLSMDLKKEIQPKNQQQNKKCQAKEMFQMHFSSQADKIASSLERAKSCFNDQKWQQERQRPTKKFISKNLGINTSPKTPKNVS